MPHTPRGLIASRVRLPPEVELSTCPGCPGWKAYSNQMSTRGRQPVPQLQGLPLHGDSKFLWVDMGAAGSTSDDQIFKHTNLRHKIEDGGIGFPDSESLGIGGPKVNFFILEDDAFILKLWLMRPYSSRTMNLKRWSSTIGSGREELWSRMPSGCWRLTLGFPEPAAAGTPGGQQGSHGLPGTAQPTEDQIPHSSTGRLWGGGPAYDSARGQ